MPRTARAVVLVAGLAALAGSAAPTVAVNGAKRDGPGSPTGPVAGETYVWRPVAIGGGGFVTGYSASASGATRVARSDVYGGYLWQPELDRWTQVVRVPAMPVADRVQAGMNEGIYEIVVAPSDADRIYMVGKGRVYRSMDRGAHWTQAAGQSPFSAAPDPNSEFRTYGPFMAASPTDPDLVLLGTPTDGLWRSRDGGLNWARVDTVPGNAALRPGPGQPSPGTLVWFETPRQVGRTGRIWAMAAGHGMFVSADGGEHFQPLARDASAAVPLLLKQGAFAPDGSFYGVDRDGKAAWLFRGGAWTDLTGRPGLPPRAYAAVAVNPGNGEVFIFDEGGSAVRSSDGGASWAWLHHRAVAGTGDPPWLRVNNQSYFATGSVRFDPVVPDRLWVAAGSGMYYADLPAGAWWITWTSQSRGIEELVANDVVQPPGQAPLFAGWDFGIHRKEDLDAYSTTYGPKERLLVSAQQLDWSPADPRFIVTNASDARMCCAEDGDAVLAGYSFDGGRTWSKFESLPTPPGTAAEDPWRMSFGSIAVSASDTANIVWAPSFNRSAFYTMDRGRHWTRVVLPGERLPATGSHASFWMQRKTLAADRVRPGTFYLVHSGDGDNPGLAGVWRTQDGGGHWERVFAGEVAPQSRFAAKLRAVPGRMGHLFFTAAVADGPDTRLRRTEDGGATWSVLPEVTHVDDVAFGRPAAESSDPVLFVSGRVAGEYGIWRSLDNARHWQRVGSFPLGSLDQVTVVEGDKDTFGRVYLGYQGSGWVYGQPGACSPAPGDRGCETVH